MNVCRKNNRPCQNLFNPVGYMPTSQWCNMEPSVCRALFSEVCAISFRPQVFQERSLSQGGGDLPLRHWHWPLCESHCSPGQHCCISTQCPGGSAYHRRSQSPLCHSNHSGPCLWAIAKCSLARPRVIPCNIRRIEKISSVRGAEVGGWVGGEGGRVRCTRRGVYFIAFLVLKFQK